MFQRFGTHDRLLFAHLGQCIFATKDGADFPALWIFCQRFGTQDRLLFAQLGQCIFATKDGADFPVYSLPCGFFVRVLRIHKRSFVHPVFGRILGFTSRIFGRIPDIRKGRIFGWSCSRFFIYKGQKPHATGKYNCAVVYYKEQKNRRDFLIFVYNIR